MYRFEEEEEHKPRDSAFTNGVKAVGMMIAGLVGAVTVLGLAGGLVSMIGRSGGWLTLTGSLGGDAALILAAGAIPIAAIFAGIDMIKDRREDREERAEERREEKAAERREQKRRERSYASRLPASLEKEFRAAAKRARESVKPIPPRVVTAPRLNSDLRFFSEV